MFQARAFARFIARASNEQLERLMSGPGRRPLLKRIFAAIPAMTKAGGSEVVEIRVRRRGAEDDAWQLHFDEAGCAVQAGSPGPAQLTTTFEPASFLQFCAGRRSAPELFMSGKLKVEGDLMLGTRLPSRFRIPSSTT